MDPVSIGLISVALIFSAVCFFIIKMAPKEKSFEEAYGKNAIKLLSDDSSKQKPKPKGKKNKEKKETTGDEKKAEDNRAKPEGKDEKVKQNSEAKSKDVESTESTSSKKKANKKSEHKKELEGEIPVEVEEVIQLKTVSAQKSTPPKPKPKKSSPLNFDRLLNRLSEAELESEVLDFVRRLNEQAQSGEKKQKEELRLKKEVNEKEREIDRLHDLLESSQTDMAKIKSLEQALAEAKEKHQVLETSMKPKINEHRQLVEKVNLLQKQMVEASAKLATAERLEKENEKLKNNVDLLSQALASANNKIYISESNLKQVEAELKKVTETPQKSADIDRLSAKLDEFAKKENIQRETIGNLQRDIGSLQAEIERRNESVNQLSNERSLLLAQLNEVRDKSGTELDHLRNDLSKWQKNYKALEEQFTKIRDAESLAKTLKEELEIVRENEKRILIEKSKMEENVIGLQKRLAQLESEVEAAKKQIDSEDSNRDQYKNKIEEFENIKAEFNQKVKKMAEDLTLYETVNKDLQSERDRLQSQISQVNGSSGSSEKLRKLEEELEYQKQRSQELRERNYKLHELVKESEENVRKVLSSQGPVKVEKRSDSEVEAVISSVAKSVGLNPPASFTAASIQEWFKKALNDGKVHTEHKSTQNGTKNDKMAEDLLQQIDRLNGEAEQYKMAINVAYEQLDHAAKLADDLQQKYESQLNEIHRKLSDHAHHFHHLSQRRGSIPSQCSEEWEVVG